MAVIRPAAKGDVSAMVDLLHQLFALEADFTFDHAVQHHGLELLLAADAAVVLVAERDGAVVGMVVGQLLLSTAEGGPALLIEDLVVAEHCRREGVGRALLAAVGGWGRERGASRLQLLADRNNGPALAFYERVGWHHTNLICLRSTTTDIFPAPPAP